MNYKPVFFLLVVLFFAACTSQKRIIYFQGKIPAINNDSIFKLRIYPGDILSVNIFTINTEAYPYLSAASDKPISDNRSAYEKGYVVNEKGELQFPLIGSVKLSDLTISEATNLLEEKFK